METILYGKGKRYQLIEEGQGPEVVTDTERNERICFAASTGFGTRSSTLDLLKRFVDLLNNKL